MTLRERIKRASRNDARLLRDRLELTGLQRHRELTDAIRAEQEAARCPR